MGLVAVTAEGCFAEIVRPSIEARYANVVSISGIEADYDGEEISFEEATKIVEAARLSALLYTSPSHTEEKPRWRVLCPTSRDLPPEQRAKLVARLNGIFGGVFAPESFTLSQSYYYGSVNYNAEHCAVIVDGDCIDLRTIWTTARSVTS